MSERSQQNDRLELAIRKNFVLPRECASSENLVSRTTKRMPSEPHLLRIKLQGEEIRLLENIIILV